MPMNNKQQVKAKEAADSCIARYLNQGDCIFKILAEAFAELGGLVWDCKTLSYEPRKMEVCDD